MDSTDVKLAGDCRAQLRSLLEQIENVSAEEAQQRVAAFIKEQEGSLYQEIGKLTRGLHETLSTFSSDDKVVALAENEIPDAKERLNYVITITEQAANRVLNEVEASLPVAADLEQQSKELLEKWRKFQSRDMTVDDFRTMTREIDAFLNSTTSNAVILHGHLSEMLLAQDFQDLTGQVIKRVINLVQDLETSLVGLIRATGEQAGPRPEPVARHQRDITACGPRVARADGDGYVDGQDEVDDLLSSLGF
ncbi:MAG TPA: protein phosphatase CheZ [Gammaproteobacteria bacterium]|nr:protein phosphatase CheZ [Gammaproteobacteria bacterium]